jgi:hypothetical protein
LAMMPCTSCGGGSTAVSWAASATFSSHWFIKVHRRHQGYPAAYQPKGWCHRAGRSLPTSGEHLTTPYQSDDDPWHLQQ